MTRRYLVIALLVILSGLATPREARELAVPATTPEPLGAPHGAAEDVVEGRAAAEPEWPAGGAPPANPVLTATDLVAGGAVTSAFADAASVTVQGILGYADASYGPAYLAIPELRGTLVTICGPAACLERVTTDVGPALHMQRAGRIADVSWVDFPVLCGVSQSRGTCPGSYTILRAPRATLPPTNTGGQP